MTNTNTTAEGRAILALLTTPMTVAMISRRASLSRSTVRTELRALANAGLVILVGNAWQLLPRDIAIAVAADADTTKATGHALSCDCTTCCGVRTEARLARELQWIPTITTTEER